jgi:hypothetical protein
MVQPTEDTPFNPPENLKEWGEWLDKQDDVTFERAIAEKVREWARERQIEDALTEDYPGMLRKTGYALVGFVFFSLALMIALTVCWYGHP